MFLKLIAFSSDVVTEVEMPVVLFCQSVTLSVRYKLVMFSKVKELRLLQPPNAKAPIVCMLPGTVIEVIEVQSRNALSPMLVKVLGRDIDVKLLHLSKAP